MNNTEFFALAQKHKTKINPFGATVQNCLESRAWRSRLWVVAYNGGGLKAGKNWKGAIYELPTKEWCGGQFITIQAKFRKYDSPQAYIANYADLIAAAYPMCRPDNFLAYFSGLSGKWATDPKYFTKLLQLAQKIAPELLGNAWRDSWYNATNYAINNRIVKQIHVKEILSTMNNIDQMRKRATEHLSPNFTRDEFACRCGCGFDKVSPELVAALQLLRSKLNRPITISSGCRCKKYNASAQVGGSKNSQHLLGTAVDIVVEGLTTTRVAQVAETIPAFANGGIGVYSTWVHLDVRHGRARWFGKEA